MNGFTSRCKQLVTLKSRKARKTPERACPALQWFSLGGWNQDHTSMIKRKVWRNEGLAHDPKHHVICQADIPVPLAGSLVFIDYVPAGWILRCLGLKLWSDSPKLCKLWWESALTMTQDKLQKQPQSFWSYRNRMFFWAQPDRSAFQSLETKLWQKGGQTGHSWMCSSEDLEKLIKGTSSGCGDVPQVLDC